MTIHLPFAPRDIGFYILGSIATTAARLIAHRDKRRGER